MYGEVTTALAAVALAAAPGTVVPAAAAEPAVQVVDEQQVTDRIVDLTLASPALGGEGRVRLLTPDGWEDREDGETWPVLYLLPDGLGDERVWVEDYAIEEWPELRDVLVVMPGMPLYGFYSDWWNHGDGGPPAVAAFHLQEVMPLLEEEYGAGGRRAAAGQSQGGFGALSYAARNPGMFRAVASYSGYVHPHQHPRTVEAGMTYLGLDWLALWGDPVRQRHLWEANDPYYLAEGLRGVPVYLSSGDGRLGPLDPPGTGPDEEIPGLEDPADPFPEDVYSPTEMLMMEESQTLAGRLREAGAKVTTHFYPGTHSPPYWERELRASLPALLAALGETGRS